jgi:hypothetical protein
MRGRGGFLADQLGAVHEAAVRVQVRGAFTFLARLLVSYLVHHHAWSVHGGNQAIWQHETCAPAASSADVDEC